MHSLKTMIYILTSIFLLESLTGCYFFRKRKTHDSGSGAATTNGVIGAPIGARAGGINNDLLAAVHATTTTHPPAAVRPDPDVVVRRLLLQYRDQGATVAREIGRVEQYRLLLGGANEDFSNDPQETYDATSLLAKLKVAEEICEGLVSPNAWQHPEWETILPAAASDATTNIQFLAQRILGIPTDSITDEMQTSLLNILNTAREGGSYTYASYIPVCATLVIDAEALLL